MRADHAVLCVLWPAGVLYSSFLVEALPLAEGLLGLCGAAGGGTASGELAAAAAEALLGFAAAALEVAATEMGAQGVERLLASLLAAFGGGEQGGGEGPARCVWAAEGLMWEKRGWLSFPRALLVVLRALLLTWLWLYRLLSCRRGSAAGG